MERRTVMDIRMFMRMEQFMGDHDHESEDHAHSEEEDMSQRTMFTVKKNTTQKSIFTARMNMIWKMWRSRDEDHAQEYLDEDDGHHVD